MITTSLRFCLRPLHLLANCEETYEIALPPQPLNPLPGAQREAEAIASLFQTQSLTGSQASKTTVLRRLPNARIIHLATHGLLNDAQPLESAIALAPDATNNGLLTAAELLQLNLGAELAVLSACDTGQDYWGWGDWFVEIAHHSRRS